MTQEEIGITSFSKRHVHFPSCCVDEDEKMYLQKFTMACTDEGARNKARNCRHMEGDYSRMSPGEELSLSVVTVTVLKHGHMTLSVQNLHYALSMQS